MESENRSSCDLVGPLMSAPDGATSPRISRRNLLAGAAATGLTIGFARRGHAAARGPASGPLFRFRNGIAGGPTGWSGAERYQYPADSAPGRAIAAAKQLKKDGKAPDTLVVGLYTGSIGSYTQPYPRGAKSVAQLWEEETGIKLKFVPVDPAAASAKAAQMAATKDGSQHIVQLGMADTGNLAEAGLLLDLSEFVAKYRPDWTDPKWGYIGGRPTVQYMNYYNGKPYAVAADGDYQVFFARKDLFEDPKEQADFKARYGSDLTYPVTWDEMARAAEFFHRPDRGLLGATDLRSPSWGWINFFMRYASTADPVQYVFDDEMNPLVNSEQGLQALNHFLATTKFGSKDALTWTWEQQYPNWGARGAAMTSAFNNLTKFIKKGSPLDTKDADSVTYAIPMPGWKVNGKLVAHTSIYVNASNGVNVHADPKYHEVAYCYLQWSASGPIYTWVNANPAGYQDVTKVAALTDPLVRDSYTSRTVDVLAQTIPTTAPSFTLRGAPEYIQALDINLAKGLSGQLAPEATLKAIVDGWNAVTDKIGREKQVAAWRAAKAGWPKQASPQG